MKLRNTSSSYGAVTIVLHWLVALVVIGLFASGLWMVSLTYYDPWYNRAPALHKAVGVLLVLVMAARLAWRWSDGVPEAEPGVRRWEARAAGVVHGVLYAGIFATAGTGYLMSTAKGDPVDVFGLFAVPATLHGLPRQEDVAGKIHYWLAIGVISVAGLHTLVAFKHHFIDRDATLLRMLGRKRSRDTKVNPQRS
jgi:cytochrome b561